MIRSSWFDGLELFRRFRKEYGQDADVPKNFRFSEDGPDLYSWINNTGSRSHKLTPEQVAELNALNFPWPKSYDEKWAKRIKDFKRAIKHNGGDPNISHRFVLPTGEKVGIWCSRIRYRRSQAKLSQERIAELDALGFDWKSSKESEALVLERQQAIKAQREERLAQLRKRFAS